MNKLATAAYMRNWRAVNKEACQLMHWKNSFRIYGMTPEEFQTQANLQCGTCAICGDIPARWRGDDFIRGLSIDHDRSCCPGTGSCGKCVRGLICNDCNRILGLLGDSTRRLKNMIDYLDEYAARKTQ